MSGEFDVALFSEMYPLSDYINNSTTTPPQLPSEMQLASEEGKQRRRRRRKKGSDEVDGPAGSTSKKRKLSEEQAKMLEMSFACDQRLETERKGRLAAELGLDPRQLAVWFQNRRARWRDKKLQDDYSELRSQYDAVVLNNSRLETQVSKLKEELNEAQKEVQRVLAETLVRCSNHSPTPSSCLLTTDTKTAVEHAGDFNFHLQDQDAYNIHGFGFDVWSSLYLAM